MSFVDELGSIIDWAKLFCNSEKQAKGALRFLADNGPRLLAEARLATAVVAWRDATNAVNWAAHAFAKWTGNVMDAYFDLQKDADDATAACDVAWEALMAAEDAYRTACAGDSETGRLNKEKA